MTDSKNFTEGNVQHDIDDYLVQQNVSSPLAAKNHANPDEDNLLFAIPAISNQPAAYTTGINEHQSPYKDKVGISLKK